MSDENESLSIANFSPARAELLKMVEVSKTVDIKNVEAVHDTRIALRDARINITKRGKEMRDGALKFQKEVIAKEKELLGLIEPEEDRLTQVEEEIKLKKEMETRRDELPSRRDALATIGDTVEASDEELLAMDDNEFNAYRIRRIEGKIAADRQALADKAQADEEERRRKLAEDEKALAEKRREEEAKIAEARAALDKEKAQLDAERKGREEAEAAAQRDVERKEKEARLEAERIAREEAARKQKEEDAKKEEKYQAFLKSIKFDSKTDIEMPSTQSNKKLILVYRKIGEYEI